MPSPPSTAATSVLLVMFHHFTVIQGTSHAERYLIRLSEFGTEGVDLFFILSGFLITGILLDTKAAPHYFRDFYIRRQRDLLVEEVIPYRSFRLRELSAKGRRMDVTATVSVEQAGLEERYLALTRREVDPDVATDR